MQPQPAVTTAPTWAPQSTQEYWSDRRGRGNFIKAWGGSSPCGQFSIARAMPKSYGARHGGIKRSSRSSPPVRLVILDISRTELGLTRRDPRSASPIGPNARVRINTARSLRPRDEGSALQGASATGDSAVTRRSPVLARVTAERQPPGVMPRSTTFEFGVRVLARLAHVNRAYATSTSVSGAYAHNHRRDHQSRRCTLQNGLPAKSSAAHGVHG